MVTIIMSKRDFRDALAPRYGWSLLDTPASCVCVWEAVRLHACDDFSQRRFPDNSPQ